MASSTCNKAHILVFPFPAQGHMLPLLDLSHQLFLRGLTVTILVTPKNLSILNPLLSNHPSIQTLVLPFPSNQTYIPPGIENVKDLPPTYFGPMIRAMGHLHEPLFRWFRTQPSPPTAILSDLFLGWTHHLASQLSIPRLVFSPSGALPLSVSAYTWRDLPQNSSDDPNALVSFPKVPNSPAFPWAHLSPLYRDGGEGDAVWEFVRDSMLANLASWGFVFNSFDALERKYLEHMRDGVQVARVWSVGPLRAFNDQQRDAADSSSLSSLLDTCDDHSVVYVCFGSQAVLTNRQMEAVAEGLERSEVRFVWATKEPTKEHVAGSYGVIPDGFEEKTMERGVVIRGWVPQAKILSHRAVGAFLTHCGWNSVLESLVAGLPMLAWPMGADQYMNAQLLVDQLGVATRVCEGRETIPNAAELAQALADSVSEKSSKRERAGELSKAALTAVKDGGSSFNDLDRLATDLRLSGTLK